MDGELTGEVARRWARRVPTSFFTLGVALTVVGVIVASWDSPADYSTTIAQATSWSHFLEAVVAGLFLGSFALASFAPRIAGWALAVSVQPLLGSVAHWEDTGDGALGQLLGWTWTAIVLLDLLLVLGQRELAGPGPSRGDGPAPVLGPDHHRGARLLAGIVVAGLMLWCLSSYAGWRTQAQGLEERAEPAMGRIVSSDTFDDSLEVRVGGRTRTFYVPDASGFAVGDDFEVMLDPTGRQRPYTALDADPDGVVDNTGFPVGLGVMALGWLWAIGRRRRRIEHVSAAAVSGMAGVRARVRPHPWSSGLEVFATNDVNGDYPVVFLPKVEPLAFPVLTTRIQRIRDGVSDLAGVGSLVKLLVSRDHGLDEEDADDEFDDDGDAVNEHDAAWERGETTSVVLHGLTHDGSFVVLRLAGTTELLLANEHPTRDRWTLLALGHALFDLMERWVPWRRVGASSRASTRIGRRLGEYAAVTSLVGVPVVAVAGWVVLPWLLEGSRPGLDTYSLALGLGVMAARWWSTRAPLVSVSRWGVRIHDFPLDVVVPPDDLDELASYFEGAPEAPKVLQATHAVRDAAARDLIAAWPASWPHRLPSAALLPGAVTFVCWVLPGYLPGYLP